jgi:hypothetical protein
VDLARRLRRFLSLSQRQKRVLLRSLVVLAWVRWTMATRGLAPVDERTSRLMTASAGDETAPKDAREVTALLMAARHALPGRSTCLHLAATLRLLLAELGIASDLRFGARFEHGTLAAHAWVECAGQVLIGGTDVHERYAAFPVIQRRGGRA